MHLLQSETCLVWYITGDRNQSHTNIPQLLAAGFGPPALPTPSWHRQVGEKLPCPVLLMSDGATLQDQRLLYVSELDVTSFCYVHDLNQGATLSRIR